MVSSFDVSTRCSTNKTVNHGSRKASRILLTPCRQSLRVRHVLPSPVTPVARTCRSLCSLCSMFIVRWSLGTALLPLLVLLASNARPSVATATAPSSTATEVSLEKRHAEDSWSTYHISYCCAVKDYSLHICVSTLGVGLCLPNRSFKRAS